MVTSPDFSPGSSQWDTNRTNRTHSPRGKYESALFLDPPELRIEVDHQVFMSDLSSIFKGGRKPVTLYAYSRANENFPTQTPT